MPRFKPLEDVMLSYKEKYVRFVGAKRKYRLIHPVGQVEISRGTVGYCYRVNGLQMFVAFKEPLNEVPHKNSLSISTWNYHIDVYPHSDKNWEVELDG